MMKRIRIATPLIAVVMMAGAPCCALAQSSQAGSPTQSISTTDWPPPPTGSALAQQGYRDGIEAAKLDTLANRRIDAKSSHLYLHPPVKGQARDEYRMAFEAGYAAALKHGVTSSS
jgi:hypothetical protein